MLQSNLGRDLKNIFLSFDEQPVAAASIAQVHHAILKDHQEVAVKVQYPGLESQMKIDITTMSFLSKSVAWNSERLFLQNLISFRRQEILRKLAKTLKITSSSGFLVYFGS